MIKVFLNWVQKTKPHIKSETGLLLFVPTMFSPGSKKAPIRSDGIKSANYQTAYRQGGGMAIAGLARAASQNISGSFTAQQYLETAIKGFEHLEGKQSIGGSCEYCNDKKENIIEFSPGSKKAPIRFNSRKSDFFL